MASEHGEFVERLEEFVRAVVREMDPHAEAIDAVLLYDERERLEAFLADRNAGVQE
jgi:hypothetical protein